LLLFHWFFNVCLPAPIALYPGTTSLQSVVPNNKLVTLIFAMNANPASEQS